MKKQNPNIYYAGAVAYAVDNDARIELNKGIIVSERDYVSNLTSGIRNYWDHHGLPCFCHSQTLPSNQEQKFGCDAIIIIRRGNEAKVCLFEAKWPRLTDRSRTWDRVNSGVSHFSSQLERQSDWTGEAAIWELFMLEHRIDNEPDYFDPWAATCIWHHEAYPFDNTYRDQSTSWNDDDLSDLAERARSRPKNIKAMVERAARCNEGEYLPIESRNVRITSDNDEDSIEVPAGLNGMEEEVEAFCLETGISNFLAIEIKKAGVE
jgi:hypothetical protein